jgi:hypothetical protein
MVSCCIHRPWDDLEEVDKLVEILFEFGVLSTRCINAQPTAPADAGSPSRLHFDALALRGCAGHSP